VLPSTTHLSGPIFEGVIAPAVRAFGELAPSLLVPVHCTGWKAVHQLAACVPEAFVQAAVGATIEL
jgi:7,8-dihydropterin-6-yl-methyl-4-(beta-D-ribofuranosyl)aminobenzene 5'-phosphate synthase